MVKKKDKENKGGGSVSSNPGSESENTPQGTDITPEKEKNPPAGGTDFAPGSPEVLSQKVQNLQDTVEMQLKQTNEIHEMFSIFSQSRARSVSIKRKREKGTPENGSKAVRQNQLTGSQQPIKPIINPPMFYSQGNNMDVDRDTETLPPTPAPQRGNENQQTVNRWAEGPPQMGPKNHPTPTPEIVSNEVLAKIESLKGMENQLNETAVKEGVSERWSKMVGSILAGFHEVISDLTKSVQKVPQYIMDTSALNAPKPSVLKKIEKLNVDEVKRTINAVKTSERERELDKCSRSIRLFNVENIGDENAYQTVSRTFKDFPEYNNSLHGFKSFFLGNPKKNKVTPIVIEFSSQDMKTDFMNLIRRGDSEIQNSQGGRYSASIHWPKDLADRIPGWKETLSANPENNNMQFYFSYKKNAKLIRIAKCKKDATNRIWEQFAVFPIPPKNAGKKFRGLPEILGGDPVVELAQVNIENQGENNTESVMSATLNDQTQINV